MRSKKADAAKYLEVFRHIGLLTTETPGWCRAAPCSVFRVAEWRGVKARCLNTEDSTPSRKNGNRALVGISHLTGAISGNHRNLLPGQMGPDIMVCQAGQAE